MDMFGEGPSEAKIQADDEVEWEYKESQDGDLIGPCSTAKMLKVSKSSKNSFLIFFSSKLATIKTFWLGELIQVISITLSELTLTCTIEQNSLPFYHCSQIKTHVHFV